MKKTDRKTKRMAYGGMVESSKTGPAGIPNYTGKARPAPRNPMPQRNKIRSAPGVFSAVGERGRGMAAGGSVGPGGGMMGGSGSGGSARTAPSGGGRTTSPSAGGGRGPSSPSGGGGGAADSGRGGGDRGISVSPNARERSTPQSATKSVGYGGRKPGPSPTSSAASLPAAFGGPSRTNDNIRAGIARAGRTLGDAVWNAQRGSRGMAAGGIVGRPARSYRDMKAGAGSGVGRIQKTKIARGR